MSLITKPSIESATHTFGTYAPVSGVIDATAQAQIITNLNSLLTLLPDPDSNTRNPQESVGTNFDTINAAALTQLFHELEQFHASLAAAPAT